MSLRLASNAVLWASKASAVVKSAFFKASTSSSRLAIALLKPSLASPCASNNALLSVTDLVKPSSVSLCAATTSFKPFPPKPSASTSSFLAVRMTFEPSSLVTTIWSPSLKPLSSWSFSIAANVAWAVAFWVFFTAFFKPSPWNSSASTSALSAVLIDLIPFLSVTTISSFSLKPLSAWAFSAAASTDCSATFSKASVRPATPLLALSALSAIASILEAASTALSAASLASFTLLSTLAESAVTLSSAALAAALASAVSCARLSTRVFTAVTSPATFSMDSESSDEALEISLSTSLNLPEISSPIAVISSAIFLLLLAMVFFSSSTSWSTALSCSSKASSMSLAKLSTRVLTAVIPPAKPTPFMLSAAISAFVASRTVLLPSSLVATKLLPAAKPLTACSSSIVFNNRAELSLSKVNFPVSSSNLVFSPKTVWNAIAFCAFSGIEARSLSAAPAAPLTTAAATARLNAFTLNFFMFFTFCGGCKDVIQASLFPVNWKRDTAWS